MNSLVLFEASTAVLSLSTAFSFVLAFRRHTAFVDALADLRRAVADREVWFAHAQAARFDLKQCHSDLASAQADLAELREIKASRQANLAKANAANAQRNEARRKQREQEAGERREATINALKGANLRPRSAVVVDVRRKQN